MTAGCIKDNSTSGESMISKVKLPADDTRVVNVGEEAVIDPLIEWNGENESDYTFRWVLNGHEDISTEKVLRYVFKDTGANYLNLFVTNKRTGISANQEYLVTVSRPFFLGWLILSKGASDESKLSFVKMDTHEFYPDIYASLYPDKPLSAKPAGLATLGLSATDQICVMHEGGDWEMLSGDNFSNISSLKEEFIGGDYPEGFEPAKIYFSQRGEDFVIGKNGVIYDRMTVSPTATTYIPNSYQFNTVPYTYKGYDNPAMYPTTVTPKFTTATFFNGSYYIPVYDEANRRWVPFGTSVSGPRNIVGMAWSGAKSTNGLDYFKGMDEGAELVYGEAYPATTSFLHITQLFTVVNKDGKTWANRANWQVNTSGAMTCTVSAYTEKEIPSEYTITKDTPMWLMSGNLTAATQYSEPFLFFAQSTKLYVYQYNTGIVKLVRDFSAGASACTGDIVSIVQRGDAQELGVLTSSGDFYVLNMPRASAMNIIQDNINADDPDNNGLEAAHVSGVPGTPLKVIFKYGKGNNRLNYKIDY